MKRRELSIMMIAFVCGIVVAFGPAVGIGRATAGTDGSVGAQGTAGATGRPSVVPDLQTPDMGEDPDAHATQSPTAAPVQGAENAGGQSGSGHAGTAATVTTTCPASTIRVSDAETLEDALLDARPGTVIALDDGVYDGEFRAAVSGTAEAPIYLCGSADAILDGDGHSAGYVFHLDGARYWRLIGFTVRNGQKGVMADGTVGSVFDGLTIHSIGDEALHLRRHSTDNTVSGNVIFDTGNRREKFGEGIYVGTAESNWCDITDCDPDRSDRNVLVGNTIYDVTAEAIDIKEGTSGGTVSANSFDGASMTEDGADSWVDVKGNNWIIENNKGVNSSMDGFQVHEILEGWGRGNRFRGNTATVNGSGFGFSLTPAQDNVVECSNSVKAAKEGYANLGCR